MEVSCMRTLFGVAVAGALGALARYGLGDVLSRRFPGFPWATLLINVTGSFLLGAVFVILTERTSASPAFRSTVMIGLIGSYTTFSTFSLETVRLLQEGSAAAAGMNVLGNLGIGLSALWLGMTVGKVV
jgi:fluoride exporter